MRSTNLHFTYLLTYLGLNASAKCKLIITRLTVWYIHSGTFIQRHALRIIDSSTVGMPYEVALSLTQFQWRRSIVKSRGVRVSRVKPSNWDCQKRTSEVNESDQ